MIIWTRIEPLIYLKWDYASTNELELPGTMQNDAFKLKVKSPQETNQLVLLFMSELSRSFTVFKK